MNFKWCILLLIVGVALQSCVSYKPQYRGEWSRQSTVIDPYYTVYLIGDAGNISVEEKSDVFNHLKNELDLEDENAAIVWLGDNIYPVGLAPKQSVYYKEGKNKLLAQLKSMENFKGQKFFIPGNHDWYSFGRIGLRRQELFVDSFLMTTPNPTSQNNFFLPDKGCGDPQTIKLTNGISLLLMDTHWFLNKKARIGDQSVCDVQSPEAYLEKITKEINQNKDKSLIVASHHPPYTYAHHGGKFSLKDDIFPLTQKFKWLYLPFPVTGYLVNRMRLRLSEQDVYHPLYKRYRLNLIEALEANGSSIVASGHEHTLQFIQRHNQNFIVSGAGTKNNKVALGKGSKFSIGEKGYVKLIFKDKDTAVIQYIVPGLFENEGNVAYEKVIEL